MKITNKLNLATRTSITLGLAFMALLTITGIYVFKTQKNKTLLRIEQGILDDLQLINSGVNTSLKYTYAKHEKSIIYGELYNNVVEEIELSDYRTSKVTITNQISRREKEIELPVIYANSGFIYKNKSICDEFTSTTGSYFAIFQKIEGGYLRIISNKPSELPDNGIGMYLPVSDNMINTVKTNGAYHSEVVFEHNLYISDYWELKTDDDVFGIVEVCTPLLAINDFKDEYKTLEYLESGYFGVLSEEGKLLVHPTGEGEYIGQTQLMKQLTVEKKQSLSGSFTYTWPENKEGVDYKMYYTYREDIEAYMAITFPYDEIFVGILNFKTTLTFTLLISFIVTVVVSFLGLRNISRKMNQLYNSMLQLAQGKETKILEVKTSDEIGKITEAVNMLAKNQTEIISYTTKISEGNLDVALKHKSEDDKLSTTLNMMRLSLLESKKAENTRRGKEELEKRKHKGMAQFNELLRYQTDEIKDFGFLIIKNLTEFLHANQAGLFIVNNENQSAPFIELIAAFAYNRRRMMKKETPVDEGLLGRVYHEKKTIKISELPDEYLEVTSGLGHSLPKSLLIVPLKINDTIIGMIEVASFNEFTDFDLSFLEEITDIVAKTLSITQNNARTTRLLEETKQQAKEMTAQEEEMRQNLEELMATQEETARLEAERTSILNAIYQATYLIEYSMEGKVLEINKNLLTISAIPKETVKLLSHKNISSLATNKEEYDEFWRDLQAGLTKDISDEVFHFENDTAFIAEVTYNIVKDQNDKPIKVLSILRNIKVTEKQA